MTTFRQHEPSPTSEELPNPADKAAALEALLTAELAEDDGSFAYRQLGERLARLKAHKDAADRAAEKTPQGTAGDRRRKGQVDEEPARLGLTRTGEYGLYTILREYSANKNEASLADCTRRMVAHLRSHQLLSAGWSNSKGGCRRTIGSRSSTAYPASAISAGS